MDHLIRWISLTLYKYWSNILHTSISDPIQYVASIFSQEPIGWGRSANSTRGSRYANVLQLLKFTARLVQWKSIRSNQNLNHAFALLRREKNREIFDEAKLAKFRKSQTDTTRKGFEHVFKSSLHTVENWGNFGVVKIGTVFVFWRPSLLLTTVERWGGCLGERKIVNQSGTEQTVRSLPGSGGEWEVSGRELCLLPPPRHPNTPPPHQSPAASHTHLIPSPPATHCP